jgi:hypothetical protein
MCCLVRHGSGPDYFVNSGFLLRGALGGASQLESLKEVLSMWMVRRRPSQNLISSPGLPSDAPFAAWNISPIIRFEATAPEQFV